MSGGDIVVLVIAGVAMIFGILPIIAWLKELIGRKDDERTE